MLLVLLLGITDFGRVFQAGIVTEAAARNTAETLAERYLRNPPGPLTAPPNPPANYYEELHELALQTACTELRGLTGITFDEATRHCAGPVYLAVCVHDSADGHCQSVPAGLSPPPADCTNMATPLQNTQFAEDPSRRYVEVRLCYEFVPIFRLVSMPIVSYVAPTIFLQKTRVFTVADY